MALEDFTVPRGSYTDYVNSGHKALVDSLNNLKNDVVVIGSDIKLAIVINNDRTNVITIDKESNPSFLNNFTAPFQKFDFSSSDAGKPGAMSVGGVRYDTGRFQFYLTKTFYDDGDNHMFYDTFCRTIGQLYQQQYMNVATKETKSSRHFGSLLSINAPIITLELQFGETTMIRYHNVKFCSPVLQSGNYIVNDAIQLMFNFAFSYISLDNKDESISFGGKQK